jgi:hypothetical protein
MTAIERVFYARACARGRVRERTCISRVRARTGVLTHCAKSSPMTPKLSAMVRKLAKIT